MKKTTRRGFLGFALFGAAGMAGALVSGDKGASNKTSDVRKISHRAVDPPPLRIDESFIREYARSVKAVYDRKPNRRRIG